VDRENGKNKEVIDEFTKYKEQMISKNLEDIREDIREMKKNIKENNHNINEVDKKRIEENGKLNNRLVDICASTERIQSQTKSTNKMLTQLELLIKENEKNTNKRIDDITMEMDGLESNVVDITSRREFSYKLILAIITGFFGFLGIFFQVIVPYILELINK